MRPKRPYNHLSVQELQKELHRLVLEFEKGQELTDQRLDSYLLLTKRIEELSETPSAQPYQTSGILEAISYCPYWTIEYLKHPVYGHLRFKTLRQGYPGFDFFPGLLDVVSRNDFITYEKDRLPLFIGTHFGIYPSPAKYLFPTNRIIAILVKSLQLGHVFGLSLYRTGIGGNKSNLLHEKIITFKNVKGM